MPNLVYDTKTENYKSAHVEGAPFDEALSLLATNNLSLIPVNINALLRRELGPQAFISRTGNYVRQGILRTPSGLYFTNNSPVLAHPGEATAAHRRSKPFMAAQEDITRALEDAVQVTRNTIPVDELATDCVGQFLFHDEAGPYSEFLLRQTNIRNISISDSLAEGEAAQLWFGGLDYGSGLLGYRGLGGDDGVRGVREVGAAGAAPKIEAYSPQQIQQALTNVGISGKLERLILKEVQRQ